MLIDIFDDLIFSIPRLFDSSLSLMLFLFIYILIWFDRFVRSNALDRPEGPATAHRPSTALAKRGIAH